MNQYVNSADIAIFPTSLRTVGGGKFTTEYNLTSFLRSVTDRDSFVIKDPKCTDTTSPHYNADYYIFVVHGFYFEVSKTAIQALQPGEATNLYAAIKVDDLGRLIRWEGTGPIDENDVCKALHFSENPPTVSSDDKIYYMNLWAADRWAKFTTDTFYHNSQSLADTLEDKQNKFKSDDENRKLDLSAGLVKNVLPIENGGTGASTMENARVGNANKLMVAGTSSYANVGNSTTPVYFSGGVPQTVNITEKASKLVDNNGTGKTVGSNTQPIYFSNGVPTAISNGSDVNIHAQGLHDDIGGVVTGGTIPIKYTGVKFANGGNPAESIHVYMSTTGPDSNIGSTGDIWLRYNA